MNRSTWMMKYLEDRCKPKADGMIDFQIMNWLNNIWYLSGLKNLENLKKI